MKNKDVKKTEGKSTKTNIGANIDWSKAGFLVDLFNKRLEQIRKNPKKAYETNFEWLRTNTGIKVNDSDFFYHLMRKYATMDQDDFINLPYETIHSDLIEYAYGLSKKNADILDNLKASQGQPISQNSARDHVDEQKESKKITGKPTVEQFRLIAGLKKGDHEEDLLILDLYWQGKEEGAIARRLATRDGNGSGNIVPTKYYDRVANHRKRIKELTGQLNYYPDAINYLIEHDILDRLTLQG